MRILGIIAGLWVGFGIWGCRSEVRVRESPLPPSLAQRRLDDPGPDSLAEHLAQQRPQDWRAHLVRALAAGNPAQRRDALTGALWLRPREPLLLYVAALDRLAAHRAESDSLAAWYLEQAAVADPGNGVLDLARAVALSRLGRLREAREVFLETRGFPQADLYGLRLEKTLLGVLQDGARLNPYALIQAREWYRKLPLPSVEEWSAALEKICLEPLKSPSRDMRRRGRASALGLYRLGKKIRAHSLDPDRVFSDGREERLIALMLEIKAADFLAHYAAASGGDPGFVIREARTLGLRLRFALRSAGTPPPDWGRYFEAWEQLHRVPALTIGEAAAALRRQALWRKVLRCRVNSGIFIPAP